MTIAENHNFPNYFCAFRSDIFVRSDMFVKFIILFAEVCKTFAEAYESLGEAHEIFAEISGNLN